MDSTLFFDFFFFFNDPATTEIYTLSLHDALPICTMTSAPASSRARHSRSHFGCSFRSEEHTSELQSRPHLVCRLLLEKKKKYDQPLDYTIIQHEITLHEVLFAFMANKKTINISLV